MRYCFLLCLLLVSFWGHAASQITGTAVSFAGKELQVHAYDDLITNKTSKIGATTIGADGTFVLEIEVQKVRPILLSIGMMKASMVAEPQTEYAIVFPELDPEKKFVPATGAHATLAFSKEGPDQLNRNIVRINRAVQLYLSDYYMEFMQHKMKYRVDSFIAQMEEAYKNNKNPYLQQHIRYQAGMIRLNANHNKNNLYRDYIEQQPVSYQSQAYVEFAQQFYSHNYSDSSYQTLPQIAEFVQLLKLFAERNVGGKAQKSEREYTLRQIMKTSDFEAHRFIAANIIRTVHRMATGNPAPDFSLKDVDGKTVNLTDYKGSHVYLGFWSPDSKPSLRELEVLKELHRRYGRKIVFISIADHPEQETVQSFVAKHKDYKWIFLHADDNNAIKEKFDVRSLPTYYLIDPDGYLLETPAPKPSENVSALFENITKKRGDRKTFEDIQDY